MNKNPSLEFLEKLTDFGIKLGLDKMRFYLEKLKNPHFKYPSILVAGTNGKGSVCRALSRILEESGYKTGLYTSPHLIDVRERIRINGIEISEEEFVEKIEKIRKIIEKQPEYLYPTYFEALTLIGFLYFAEKNIDILVCEVGMGGRFDATNVLPSFVEIITKIGMDHMEFLGKTYKEIASEKAGIIKEKTVVFSSKQKKEAEDVIKKKAREKGAKVYIYRDDFKGKLVLISPEEMIFDFYGERKIRNLKTDLLGKHQIENLSIAIETALFLNKKGYRIKEENIKKAIENVGWQARFQIIRKNPYIIIDGAHNLDGIKNLIRNLKDIFPDKKFSFLVGILKDKEYQKMVNEIEKFAEHIIFTKPNTERALSPEILAKSVKRKNIEIIENPEKAYRFIINSEKNWVICGSLYLCGDILNILKSSQFLTEKQEKL